MKIFFLIIAAVWISSCKTGRKASTSQAKSASKPSPTAVVPSPKKGGLSPKLDEKISPKKVERPRIYSFNSQSDIRYVLGKLSFQTVNKDLHTMRQNGVQLIDSALASNKAKDCDSLNAIDANIGQIKSHVRISKNDSVVSTFDRAAISSSLRFLESEIKSQCRQS